MIYMGLTISLLFGLCVGVVIGIAFMHIKMAMKELDVPAVDHFENVRVAESTKRKSVDIVVTARQIEVSNV